MVTENLYQKIILDHYRHPRNFGKLEIISRRAESENPICGDSIQLMVFLNDKSEVEKISFEGRGCAVATASASMMTEVVKGKTRQEATQIARDFIAAMRGEKEAALLKQYGDLVAFQGVVRFPVRVKCAVLAWQALQDVLSVPGEKGC
jgi:nitrogen fixation NifU-like protein